MPGYNCSIKERMLYASCRNAVIETIESFDVEAEKKVKFLKTHEVVAVVRHTSFPPIPTAPEDLTLFEQYLLFFQMEIESGKELTENNLLEELHPKENLIKKTFEKPKPPRQRGGDQRRRMIKVPQSPSDTSS